MTYSSTNSNSLFLANESESLMDAMEFGFIVLDANKKITKVSSIVGLMVPIFPGDVGESVETVFARLDWHGLSSLFDLAQRTKRVQQKEIDTSDKQCLLLRVAAVDVYGAEPEFIITLVNVTNLKVNEFAFQAAIDQLRQTVEETVLGDSARSFQTLIVDDSTIDIRMLRKQLQEAWTDVSDIVVQSESDPDEAITKLKENNYDACILDYRIAPFEAEEILEQVQDSCPNTAFIVVSTSPLPMPKRKALLQFNVYDFITKDEITPALLMRSLRYSIRHRKTERFVDKLKHYKGDKH